MDYKNWVCISDKCEEVMRNYEGEPEKLFSRDTICENSLQPGVDFMWTINRTSYALEWGLICSDESKGSNLKSFFFAGAFIGLIIGTALFDRIGRKMTTLIGIAITVFSSVSAVFVKNYSVMLFLKVVQGCGAFIAVTGVDILGVEFTPSNMRNLCQVLGNAVWNIGAMIYVGIAYAIKDWHYIYVVQGCFLALTAIPVLIYPESPRFQLVKGREEEALATFKKISKIFKTSDKIDKVELKFEDYGKNYLGQIQDIVKYPVMLKNTLILMTGWGFISCITYGLFFSWGKLGANIYSSVAFTTLGNFISKVSGMDYYVIHFFGRKNAVVFNFTGVALVFFIAIPSYGVKVSDTWMLEQIVCLFTSLFIGGVWNASTLLTKELSPTSHRGMIYCVCSATARVGAFIGPYLALLYNTMDPRIVLAIFGSMAAFPAFLAYFNSDSTDKPIPSVPEDLIRLHSDKDQSSDDLEQKMWT